MEIRPYLRRANYYETDQMSIVHHSNYFRYFEEARIEFMHAIGCDVKDMEKLGIIIPNVDAYAKYIKTIVFYKLMQIETKLVKFNGAKMVFEYIIKFADTNEVAATGHTTHCFVNNEHRPMSIKHTFPDIYNRLKENITN